MNELLEWIISTLKVDRTELVTESEDGETSLSENFKSMLDTAYVGKLNKIKTDQYNKGVKDKAVSIEKLLTENNVEISGKVEDALQTFIDSKSTVDEGKKLEDFTDAELLAMPKVKQHIEDVVKKHVTKYDTLKSEYEGYKTEITTSQLKSVSDKKIREAFLKLNPVLSEDESTKEKQIAAFINSVPMSKLKMFGDELLPIDDAGERLKDDRYEEIGFDEFIAGYNFFDTHKVDKDKQTTTTTTKFTDSKGVPKFKDITEVNKYLSTETDPEKRKAAVAAFKSQRDK